MKAIVIKATGAKVQFADSAAKTKAALEAAGVTIGLSTVKLLQNGSKHTACGVEVVEIKEQKAKRGSKMILEIIEKYPSIKDLVDAGFKPFGVEVKHHFRVCFAKEGQDKISINVGKRGVNLRNLNTKKTQVFAEMKDAVKHIVG